MATYPQELDCPGWAYKEVQKVRERLNLPEKVTNRMIYARLDQGYRTKLNEAALDASLTNLIAEVEAYDASAHA